MYFSVEVVRMVAVIRHLEKGYLALLIGVCMLRTRLPFV